MQPHPNMSAQTAALERQKKKQKETTSISEDDPRMCVRLLRQKIGKALCPDSLSPSCLTVCADQLAPTFTPRSPPTGLKDCRAAALTSVVMKSCKIHVAHPEEQYRSEANKNVRY